MKRIFVALKLHNFSFIVCYIIFMKFVVFRGEKMSVIDSRRYGKPCMTNLPANLGRAIFKHILSTPPVDDEKMKAESARLVSEMLKVRRAEIEMETKNANT